MVSNSGTTRHPARLRVVGQLEIHSSRAAENPIEVDAVSSLRKMNVISFPIQFALISKRDLCFAGERSSNGMQRSVRAVSRTAPSFV